MSNKHSILAVILFGLGAGLLDAQQPAPPQPAPPATPAAPAGLTPPATNAIGPKIVFATPIYDFGKVKSGDPVKYTYIFTNIGDQTLEISAVRPSCGCTTAGEWTKKAEPGQTGTIAVQFNSANFNGQVFKTVTVTSSDKAQPNAVLQLKGTVWKPIEAQPQMPVMNFPSDALAYSTTVKIVNNTEEPVTLSPPECNNQSLAVRVSTNQPGKEYQLTISIVPPMTAGVSQPHITIKTSSTNVPSIDLPVYLNVQAAVTITPAQLVLPPAPLASPSTLAVTIQNNGTNIVSLSEPTVSLPGVDAQLKETVVGRIFNATLTFPQGFEVPQGQQAFFTVKTSHPQFPQLKVPVIQPAAAVKSPQPAAPHAAGAPPAPPARPASH